MENFCKDPNISLSSYQMGLLRRYNQLESHRKEGEGKQPDYLQCLPRNPHQDKNNSLTSIAALDFNPLFGAFHPYSPINLSHQLPDCKSRLLHPLILGTREYCHRRVRGEKKSIPDSQKDERYFERRKRNNQAAKKSRDARKIREDQVALRAAILEHENAMMRAQIITLREETQALRSMLVLSKKSPQLDTMTSPSSLFLKPPSVTPGIVNESLP